MKKEPKDLAASVHGRLLHMARERREDFQRVLVRYAAERFLYRLSRSAAGDRFILKGAMLFAVWGEAGHRPTKDMDFLKHGGSEVDDVVAAVREAMGAEVEPDGLDFDAGSLSGERIREDQDYEGVRVTGVAYLGKARIPVQIDVGFGDAVTPGPEEVVYPTLLDLPPPHLRAYPRATVVAEKFEALVKLGIANSRMKDFFDLWFLSRHFAFDGPLLAAAVRATFERRGTPVPEGAPTGLTDEFAVHPEKAAQWRAFVGRTGIDAPPLPEVVAALRPFLLPVGAAAHGRPLERAWPPGGPWENTLGGG